MGNWYTNIILKKVNPLDVLRQLRGLRRKAIVYASQNDWTTVYDEECDRFDLNALESLALTLSNELRCVAVPCFNADDDVLWFAIYRNGERLSRYASALDQFEDGGEFPSTREFASTLSEIFDQQAVVGTVRGLLGRRHGAWGLLRIIKIPVGYLFEIERHRDLAEVLGMPRAAIGLGYTYVARGEMADGMDAAGLLRT